MLERFLGFPGACVRTCSTARGMSRGPINKISLLCCTWHAADRLDYKIADTLTGEFARDVWFDGDALVRTKIIGSDNSVILSDLR